MNNRLKGSLLILFVFSIMVVAGCGQNNQSSNTQNVNTSEKKAGTIYELTVATVGNTALYGPIYLAQEKDIWSQYGLKVKLVSLDAAASTAAMVAGDVQIVAGGPAIVDAAIKTDKVKVIGTEGKIALALYANKMNKLQDLKGKTLGVTAAGGSIDTASRSALKTVGLQAGKDVKFLYTGGNPATLAAIKAGKIDAGVLSPPTTIQAEEMGLKLVANLTDTKGTVGLYGIMGVNQPYATKNPEAVEAFMNAVVNAIKLSKTDKEATKAAIGKYTKTTDDKILEVSYNGYKDYWFEDIHVPEQEIQVILDGLAEKNPEAKSKTVANVLDNRYADAVKK